MLLSLDHNNNDDDDYDDDDAGGGGGDRPLGRSSADHSCVRRPI